MKKWVLIFLSIVMMLVLAVPALAQAVTDELGTSDSCGDGVTYTVSNGVLTISGTGAINDYAFFNASTDLSGITSVVIEEGVTAIGNFAFAGNANHAEFTSVSIPASVASIGKSAFSGFSSLSEVNIADGSPLTTISRYAFDSCGLSSIVLPCSQLSSIGDGAFSRNYSLKEIVCLTQASLSVHNDALYSISDKVTVYMPASKKVSWPRAKAIKGLVSSITPGSGVSSITVDAGDDVKKTSGDKTYYVGGSTVKLSLESSLTGGVILYDCGNARLPRGEDGKYTLTLPENEDTVTVTASVAQDISAATVTLGQYEYTYDGQSKKPAVTVVFNSKTLVQDIDYTISYSDNIQPGTATVNVSGMGDYCGTAKKTFSIKVPGIEGLPQAEDGLSSLPFSQESPPVNFSKSMTVCRSFFPKALLPRGSIHLLPLLM